MQRHRISFILGISLMALLVKPPQSATIQRGMTNRPPAIQKNSSSPPAATTLQAEVSAAYSRRPLSFEVNHGQADEVVKFLCRGQGYTADVRTHLVAMPPS